MKLFVSFLLLCSISVCIGCKCALRPLEADFCNADFTIKIRVKSEKQIIPENIAYYKIDVLKIYKACRKTRRALCSGRIYTAIESATCGRFFEEDKTYIVTGSLDKVYLRAITNSCTFGKNVKELEPAEKRFLNDCNSYECPPE